MWLACYIFHTYPTDFLTSYQSSSQEDKSLWEYIKKKNYLLVLGGSKVIYRMFLVTILLDPIVNVKYLDHFIACQSKWIMLNSKLKKMHN